VHGVWKVEASVVVILERPPPFCVGCVQSVLEVSDLHHLSPRVSSQQGPDTCTSCTIAFGKNAALFVALDVGESCVPSFPVRWFRGSRSLISFIFCIHCTRSFLNPMGGACMRQGRQVIISAIRRGPEKGRGWLSFALG